MFTFNDKDVMAKNKDLLQTSLQSNLARASVKEKEAEAAAAAAEAAASASSASAVSTPQVSARTSTVSLDPKKLLQNLQLHQSLLKENAELTKTFQETVMQGGLPYEEFWTTRVHILRAHALAISQRRGPYNVLSTIKPITNSENMASVSVSRDKIRDIFEQYPLVQQAYNECVPKIAEGEFWARFFSSRLFRSLRGEKQKASDPTDLMLDKYLDYIDNSSLSGVKRKASEMAPDIDYNVPFFLDIAGNEESDPQKLGNRPDMTMRSGTEGPSALSLIRSMNNLSQKMIYGPTDSGASISVQDKNSEATNLAQELKLHGLEEDVTPDFMELHLKHKTPLEDHHATTTIIKEDPDGSAIESSEPAAPKPSHDQIINYLKSNLEHSLDLQEAGLKHPDGMSRAQKQITRTIKLRAKEASSNRTHEEREIEKDVYDHVHLCHAASVEFLRHFWLHFQSGDPAQAPAITKLVASLKKSLQRIDAVEKSATENQELVKSALQPLTDSIRKAIYVYNKALAEVVASNNSTPVPS